MLETLMTRRAIFTPELELVGYELLFNGLGEGIDEGESPALLVGRTLGEIGWAPIVGDHAAWLEATAELSNPQALESLPRPTVLRIDASRQLGDSELGAIDQLRAGGFRISLGPFDHGRADEALLERADYVEIDVAPDEHDRARATIEAIESHNVSRVAKRVDDRESQELARELGFDLLSGHFFVEPELASVEQLAPGRLAVLQLLGALQNPEVGFHEIQELISRDPSLSYRLLRYINSAYFGLRRQVGSIGQAVVLLGLNNVKRWLTMIILSGVESEPAELITVALVRARFCELAGGVAGMKDVDGLFTIGLFSVLDALIGAPIKEVIAKLSLPEEISDALVHRAGARGALLAAAIGCERGERAAIAALGVPAAAVAEAYLQAQAWASETESTLGHAG